MSAQSSLAQFPLAASLFVASLAAAEAQRLDLTGIWQATEEKAKKGSCASARKNRLDRDHRRRHSSFRYLYAIEQAEDGTFSISAADPEERSSSPRWIGGLGDDGTVRTRRQHHAYCRGESYSNETAYDGVLRIKKGRPRMVLKGRLEICTSGSCLYRVRIVLTKQGVRDDS